MFNDVAIAIRRLKRDGAIARAAIVDCDVHAGNGTGYVITISYVPLHKLHTRVKIGRRPALDSVNLRIKQVEDPYPIPSGQQAVCGMGADESGSAGDKYFLH